jgi:hypothetical protein
MRWLCVLALVAACSKKKDEAPPPTNNPPAIPADELKRGQDACKAYVEKACACAATVEAAKAKCEEAKAWPDVVKMGTEMTMSTDSTTKDVKQAAMTVRKTIAECIQQTAQLPTLGCP